MTSCFALSAAAHADQLNVSGGLDLRGLAGTPAGVDVNGAFVNLRQVFTQDGADRWIVVAQADSGDNGESPHLYQTYVQYKGALGSWNVRAGRLIVPFGLLAGYDSERQVLNTMEPLSLGLKLNEGIEVNGYTSAFDYAVTVTDGVRDHNPVATARIGKTWDTLNVGVSFLSGKLPEVATLESVELPNHVLPNVPLVDKRRIGVDTTLEDGPNLWRAEAIAGTDNGRFVKGGYVEYERALNAAWTIGTNLGAWNGAKVRSRYGAAITRDLGVGRLLRLAYVHERQPEGRDGLVLQFYWEFSRAL